jgi:hypothetical protein
MEPLFCSICSIRFICHFDTNVFESLFLFADTYQFNFEDQSRERFDVCTSSS